MLIDTHCHLHFDAFDSDRQSVIDRAQAAGVQYLINVGTDPENNEKAFDLAKRHPFMRHTAGLHPHSAHGVGNAEAAKGSFLTALEEFIQRSHPVAIGEIGLDYFKSEADPDTQKKVFRQMLGLAKKYDLPVIVHSRNAFEDTYEILRSESAEGLRGVMHCFSYDGSALKKIIDIGFLASFTCNLTFKNSAALLEVALKAPLERVMLETDAPYLAPQSRRGQRNEPSFLPELAAFLAEKKGIATEKLIETTTENALRFFGISKDRV